MPDSLLPAKGKSFYWSGRLSIGVYVNNNVAVLIDSGLDEGTAKNVNKELVRLGYTVGAIINTHHHADHCGGNAFFQKAYPQLKIYSTKYEKAFIEMPELETQCFCCGAAPIADLRNKYLETTPSNVTHVIEPYQDQVIDINGERFSIVVLPGHTPGMIGIKTPDNILYCGDAIFGDDAFNKHGMLLYTNIQHTLASFTKLASFAMDACVFYHGGLIADIKDIVKKHEKRILETEEVIFNILNQDKHSLDTLTQAVMNEYKVPDNIMQFTLTRASVQAFVTHLEQQKRITPAMNRGLLEFASEECRKRLC